MSEGYWGAVSEPDDVCPAIAFEEFRFLLCLACATVRLYPT
jgi:hypothetical protein